MLCIVKWNWVSSYRKKYKYYFGYFFFKVRIKEILIFIIHYLFCLFSYKLCHILEPVLISLAIILV